MMSAKPNYYLQVTNSAAMEGRKEGSFLEAHILPPLSPFKHPFSPSSSSSSSSSPTKSLFLLFSSSQNRMKLFFFLSTSTSSHHTTKSNKSDNNIKKTSFPPHWKPKLSTSSSTKSATSSFSETSFASPTTVIPQRHRRSLTSSLSSLPPLNKFTREELSIVLRRLGADENADGVIPAILADGDGLISVDEFASTFTNDDDELRAAFGVYDADGDGRISAEELHCALLMLGDCDCSMEDCRMMINGVDSDGDGFVSFDDFVKMMAMDGRILPTGDVKTRSV